MRRAPLLLAVGGEPFEYPHPDWGDAVHFIGACVFEQAGARRPRTGWKPSTGLSCWSTPPQSPRPTPTSGTSRCVLWLDEPVHVVATFPAGIPRGLPRAPNATVCEFLPHGAVLDRVICVVTHGGMGTTVKALNRGIPVCVVPYARDQAEVARRVQVAGCGTRLPPKRLNPARLRAAVREAADNGARSTTCRRGFRRDRRRGARSRADRAALAVNCRV